VFASFGLQRAGCVIGRFGSRINAGSLLLSQIEEDDDDAADAVEDMDASGEVDFSKKKKKTKKKKDEKGKDTSHTTPGAVALYMPLYPTALACNEYPLGMSLHRTARERSAVLSFIQHAPASERLDSITMCRSAFL
jgi:hypothetical protein